MTKILIIFSSAVLLSSCAHHDDVRPGVDGVHRVIIQTDDKEAGSREAIEQANDFCKEQHKYAAFVEEQQKYTGDMDEKSYRKAKTVAKVANAAGGAVWVFGGKSESNAGGIVGLGGAIADKAIGKGYTVDMKFVCK
jgi:hypothetical protein